MSTLTRNTFHPKCEVPGIVLTRVTPFRNSECSERTLQKSSPSFPSLAEAKKTRKPTLSYDQSLIMLSNSLEQICRKSNSESSAKSPAVPSPLLSYSPPARPLSHSFKPSPTLPDCTVNVSKSPPLLKTILKQNSTENIQIRVKHEETGDKLKEDLNKIISTSPAISYPEDNHIVMIRKKLTDAQEFLRTKFRLKINTSKYPNDASTNFYVVVNKTRLIKVTHVSSKPMEDNPTQLPITQEEDTDFTLPLKHSPLNRPLFHCDSMQEFDDPVNIHTVLHSSTIPNNVRLERLLGSFIEGPCIYIRPSSMATAEYSNIKLISIPILHLNEASLRLSLSLKVPFEIPTDNVEVRRVDDKLTIKGTGHHFLCSENHEQDSVLESSFKVNVELPEDTDGRSLVAYVTSKRLLIVEADLLSTSRRMTCQF